MIGEAFLIMLLQASDPARLAEGSQEGFFGWGIWIVVLVPLIAAVVIGLSNRYAKQTVQEFDPASLAAAVRSDSRPLLVHFYRPWSIGDQCLIAQVEKLASKARGYDVGFVNVEKFPEVLGLYTHIGAPALLLFAGGQRRFQCEGIFDAADIESEVQEVLAGRQPV